MSPYRESPKDKPRRISRWKRFGLVDLTMATGNVFFAFAVYVCVQRGMPFCAFVAFSFIVFITLEAMR